MSSNRSRQSSGPRTTWPISSRSIRRSAIISKTTFRRAVKPLSISFAGFVRSSTTRYGSRVAELTGARVVMSNPTQPESWPYFVSEQRMLEVPWYREFLEDDQRTLWVYPNRVASIRSTKSSRSSAGRPILLQRRYSTFREPISARYWSMSSSSRSTETCATLRSSRCSSQSSPKTANFGTMLRRAEIR